MPTHMIAKPGHAEAWSNRGTALTSLQRFEEAVKSYARALALATNDAERRFLERRLREVMSSAE